MNFKRKIKALNNVKLAICLIIVIMINNLCVFNIGSMINPSYASSVDALIPETTKAPDNPNIDVFVNGYIVYNSRLYSKAYMNGDKTKKFFEALDEFHQDFKDVNMYFIPVPMSQIMIEHIGRFKYSLTSQSEMVRKYQEYAKDTNIEVLNICDRLVKHRDEYLYFYYDHHWTSRGAYYAYQEFCKAKDEFCDPISYYREKILNTEYRGGAYNKVAPNNTTILGKSDTLYVYIASISNTLKIMTNSGKVIQEVPCINEKQSTYWGVYGGDQAYEKIHAENNKNKSVLVLKDSFGCAFIPYLISNYSDIYIVDPRFATFDVYDRLKDVDIEDIIVIGAMYVTGTDVFIDGLKTIKHKKDEKAE